MGKVKLLVLTGTCKPFWLYHLITQINAMGIVEATCLTILDLGPKNPRLQGWSLVNSLSRFKEIGKVTNWLSPVEIQDCDECRLDDLQDKLVGLHFDHILWGGDTDGLQALSVPEFEVWYFDSVAVKDEQMDGITKNITKGVNHMTLSLLSRGGSKVKLIEQSVIAIQANSIKQTRQSYSQLTGLVVRAIQRWRQTGSWYRKEEPWQPPPGEHGVLWWSVLRSLVKSVSESIKNKFIRPRWIIGVKYGAKAMDENLISEVDFISPINGYEWADPFIFEHQSKPFALIEQIDRSGNGSIVCLDLQSNVVEPVLKKPSHMSYPFIFNWEGKLYMVPESSAAEVVSIYENQESPAKWKFVKHILEGYPLVDATLIAFKGKWWLFGCSNKYAASFNEELHIFFADSPVGTWTPHPLNPVKNDVRNSRPAGAMLIKDGKLYRPVQDCALRYGHKITWMEVLDLSLRSFHEEEVFSIEPSETSEFLGHHTVNQSNNYTIVDGYYRGEKW